MPRAASTCVCVNKPKSPQWVNFVVWRINWWTGEGLVKNVGVVMVGFVDRVNISRKNDLPPPVTAFEISNQSSWIHNCCSACIVFFVDRKKVKVKSLKNKNHFSFKKTIVELFSCTVKKNIPAKRHYGSVLSYFTNKAINIKFLAIFPQR